jgi:hypothetical protein
MKWRYHRFHLEQRNRHHKKNDVNWDWKQINSQVELCGFFSISVDRLLLIYQFLKSGGVKTEKRVEFKRKTQKQTKKKGKED